MKIGLLEIVAALGKLCKPDPEGAMHFDPARDKPIELYGAAVDHLDFVYVV